jgi:uncharacterized membrane protein YfcA
MVLGQIVALLLATLVGLSLGALGSGGSIITTPVLVYVAGVPADNAIGMSLMIVGMTSLVGALLHWRRGNVAIKPSLLFAATGMIGSYIGSKGTHHFSQRSLMLMFAAIMLIAGVRMWLSTTGSLEKGSFNPLRCLSIGLAVGLLSGFLGIGGGFLIVPALVLFAGLDSRTAVGTSLAVIALNSTTGVAGQLRYATVDWRLVIGFLVFALCGMVVGTMAVSRLAELRLRRLFATTVLVLAFVIGAQNLVLMLSAR